MAGQMFVANEEQLAELKALRDRAQDLALAEQRYSDQMQRTWALRIPNVRIALELGKSETAVRTWFRRRGYSARTPKERG